MGPMIVGARLVAVHSCGDFSATDFTSPGSKTEVSIVCVPTCSVDMDKDVFYIRIIQIIAEKSERFQSLVVETTAVTHFRIVVKCSDSHQGTGQWVPAPIEKHFGFTFELISVMIYCT
jgi:hypothetical protein